MPSVMDTPELEIAHVETYDLSIEEQPRARDARPGFWRTLAHGITTYLASTPHERPAPVCRVSRPFETPMDRLVREHPSVATYALAMI
jgi:hypothetical protein